MKGCRGFSEKEIKMIIGYTNGTFEKRDKCLMLLGIATGLRISELLSLTIKDVYKSDQVRNSLYIERKNVKKKTEGATIILSGYSKKAILEYMQDRTIESDNDPLFKSRKGSKAITRIQAYRIIEKMADSLSFDGKIGTHSLRKTFAKRAYEMFNGDLFKCQKALRHKMMDSTVSYINIEEEKIFQKIADRELY